ncbi:MAG: hypothetical protein JWQ35_1591 [Bacteriovoracaceae bacterium]|nr:hypothetical protein [Bacteriovoracaceae bacterium]
MKKSYAKSLKEYDKPSIFEAEKILEAMKRAYKGRKVPTSIALDPQTVKELKAVAKEKHLPYQVLMRLFILDGLTRAH